MKKYLTKEGVISGIIASVLFTFMLQPLVEMLISKAGNVVDGLEKHIISQCAKTTYLSLLIGLATILIGCLLGVALSVLFSSCSFAKRKNKKKKISEKKEEDLAVLAKEIEEISTEVGILERRWVVYKIAMSVVIILWICMIFITYILPSSMYSNFVVSVEKISPYVSEAEVINLKARWREMETWSDYEEIEEYIKTIETK